MRKLKSFWALLCLLLVSTSVTYAETDMDVVGDVMWQFDTSTGKLIISGTGSMGTTTPNYLSKYKTQIKTVSIANAVTSVCSYAFDGCTNLSSVTVGTGVTTIGSYAFRSCTSLKSISLPSSVKTIGTYAFLNSGLTSFTVPTSCTSIGEGALSSNAITSFYSNSTSFSPKNSNTMLVSSAGVLVAGSVNTVSLNLADTGVKTIAGYAYRYNSKLKIIYNASVTAVGNYAFYNASGIKALSFTGAACTFASNAFSSSIKSSCIASCWNATTVTNLKAFVTNTFAQKCGDSMSWAMESDGTTIEFWGSGTMTSTPWSAINSKITGIYMPSGATSIAANAFKGCTKLTSFTGTWTGITSVGAGAFSGCTSITALPPFVSSSTTALTTIGNSAFDGCTKLTSFDLSVYTKLTTLGTGVFRNCTGLTRATFTSKVTSIPKAFCKNCTSLASVSLYTNLASVGDSAFAYTSISNFYFDQLTSLKTIGREAFSGAKFTTVTNLPSSLTTIGHYAFEKNTSLTSFSVPSGVTSIGSAPLYGCTSLTSITGGNSTYSVSNNGIYKGNVLVQGCKNTVLKSTTTELADYAFSGHDIKSITFPATLTTIASTALNDPTLTSIIDKRTDASKVTLTSDHFNSTTRSSCKVQVTSADIKAKYTAANFTAANVMVTSCGTNLTWSFNPSNGALTISGTGTTITSYSSAASYPWNAIRTQIKKVIIPTSVTNIPAYAFDGCTNLTWINAAGDDYFDNVTSIGDYAFRNTALTVTSGQSNFYLPDRLQSLGTGVFYGCSKIKLATYGTNNDYFSSEGGCIMSKDKTKLYVASAETTVVPSTCTSINAYAFSTGAVKTLTIPSSVTSFNSNAFSGASSITTLNYATANAPLGYGNLSKTGCTVHVQVANQTSAQTVYNYFKTTNSFSNVVYDYCGTNLKWSISSGKLTITNTNEAGSTGAMWDFASSAAKLPWYSNRSSITNVVFSGTVTKIGSYAFDNTNLASITIPGTVTSIGANAFSNTVKLTSVVLPSELKTIGNNAFSGSAITSIAIPAKVSSIGTWGTTAHKITSVKVDPANETFTSQDEQGNELNMILSKDGLTLTLCANTTENVALPNLLKTVEAGAFANSVGKLTIPASVTTMNSWPANATSIHAANVPTTAATVPSTLKSVKVYASSAAVKNKYSALGFTNIVTGTSCGDKASYILENGVLTIMGTGSTNSAPWLTNDAAKIRRVVIESGIIDIEKESFKDCANLTYVSFPEGFETIGNSSFSGCTNLKTVQLPSTLYNVLGAFVGSSVENVSVVPGGAYTSQDKNGNELNALIWSGELEFGLTSNIPNTVTAIKYNAFTTSTIKEVSIPSSVTEIDNNAFLGNTTLASIYCSSTAAVTNAFDPAIKSKAKVYVATAAIKTNFVNAGFKEANVIVADGTIGADVYYCVAGTKLIVFGSGATYSYSGFAQFKSGTLDKTAIIRSIVIAEGVTSLGNNVFKGCTALAGKVVVPMSVTSIGSGTFGGATKITSVVSDNVKPAAMNPAAFTNDVYAKAALIVSDASRVKYLNAAGWENFGGVQSTEEVANPYDLNKDGYVDSDDLFILKKNMK